MSNCIFNPDDYFISLDSHCMSTHVTAINFFAEFLLIGEGNHLKIFEWKKTELCHSVSVFKGCSIHGIVIDTRKHKNCQVLLFGSKSIRIYDFLNNHARLNPLSEEQILEDWIYDVQWLFEENSIVAVALAHNNILLWNWKDAVVHKKVECRERCILYSAKFLGHNWRNLVLAAGTVFNEVLLWSPNTEDGIEDNKKIPMHRLCGHQGVIFSIAYNTSLQMLCSTSDDRTVRLWKFVVSTITISEHDSVVLSLKNWRQGKFVSVHTLYAHESRVWMSAVLKTCIISVGEDSNICFWNHKGVLIKKEKCHKGGSIWCLGINGDHSIAATGGSDSGVSLWNIQQVLKENPTLKISLPHSACNSSDFPRNLSLLVSQKHCVMILTTDQGQVMSYDIRHQVWKEEHVDVSYSSYSVLAKSTTNKLLAVGNMAGRILIFIFSESETTFKISFCGQWSIHDGKVNNIHWISENPHYILTCGLHGEMKIWHFQEENQKFSLNVMTSLHLPINKRHWWSSAALWVPSIDNLIIGDRAGSIFIYQHVLNQKGSNQKRNPYTTHQYIHGRNGVTDIIQDKRFIYTTGRDGKVLLYEISLHNISLLHAVKVSKHLEWIGKMVHMNDDIILLGFHTSNFIAWSTRLEQPVMNVSCGGGHRSWDFSFTKDYEAAFIAIKKKEILIFSDDLTFLLSKSVVKSGISGRELCCVHHICSKEDFQGNMAVVACSGEENSLKIIGIKNSVRNFCSVKPILEVSGHLSSIKSIASCQMNETNIYIMVSVGGRAQMIVWKVECEEDIVCKELTQDVLWSGEPLSRKPWKDNGHKLNDPQTRYMDVVVWCSKHTQQGGEYIIITACSDSFIRGYSFSSEDCKLSQGFSVQDGNHCVIRLSRICLKLDCFETSILLTGASDGLMKAYQCALSSKPTDHSPKDCDIEHFCIQVCDKAQTICGKHIFKCSFHQSGINAVDAKKISDSHWLLCSGGDDNCLTIALITMKCNVSNGCENDMTVLAMGQMKTAHAAQITGLRFLTQCFLVSVSIDQRLNLWYWSIHDKIIHLHLIRSKITFVSDVSNIEVWWNKCQRNWTVVICGEGIEVFHLHMKNKKES